MKRFRELLSEMSAHVPVVSIFTTGTDAAIPEIKNEINRNLDITLTPQYQTVEEALTKVSKILAMYGLDIPYVDSDNKESDSMVLNVGHKNITWDEFDGGDTTAKFQLKFSYKVENGLYSCEAKLI